MPQTHPHAEATYRVVPFDGEWLAVEVSIPDTNPTLVSKFATRREAEAWIADHQQRVLSQSQAGGWFRRAGRPRGG